eukprot:TRINITY_DN1809_c0_g1_i3.p1 TRINITY_DN1809_c0_g1~~TRINITY_DN1809_c0_g1_i3.p1  ORF type:complete len:227 (+),score=42.44 TRINITY_DN1809_c0_g1_i3:121-801(+)
MFFFFFFKQKTAYEMLRSLVGSEMCIRDRHKAVHYHSQKTSGVDGKEGEHNKSRDDSHEVVTVGLDEVVASDCHLVNVVLSEAPDKSPEYRGVGSTPCIAKPVGNAADKISEKNCHKGHNETVVLGRAVHVGTVDIEATDANEIIKPKRCSHSKEGNLTSTLSGGVPLCELLCVLFTNGSHRANKVQRPVLCVDTCLLYTSDAADEEDSVDLGGRRIIKKKKTEET